ncbi:hypothetical protein [Shewanella sp.]|uniref:hypothetical protein n=1 Tax=Shewanella sp. TaxID=50422 RepID=UPI00258275D3|nr:hypothetical protein [Shewanella sp.]MCJ8302256.1 hypothetical protein [Shewanella sp.]
MVLLCQFFSIGSAFSVQYPSGEHPMGIDVSHHHSHIDSSKSYSSNSYAENSQVSHHHAPLAFNATEPVPSAFESNELTILDGASTVNTEAEHEHANHSHTQSHPPAEPIIISSFFQSEILTDDDITYLNCRHAPPIPPPHT